MPSSRSLSLAAAIALLAVPALSACGGSGSGVPVKVAAKDNACEVAKTALTAGSYTFKVNNEGSQVTEVYVYGKQGSRFSKIVGEAENIGPGTSRDLTVKLGDGTYEVACKPGQKGDGIRQRITVS